MPTPFRYDTPSNSAADSIGRLLLQRGEIEANRSTQVANAQARAAQVSGEAWGGAVRDIGGIAANTIGAVVKQNEEKKVKQTLKAQDQAFMHAWGPNGEPPAPNIVMGIYGPERGADIAKGLSAIAELHTGQIKDARDTAGRLAIGVKALSPEAQAQFWPSIRASAIRGGLGDEKSIPEQATPEYLDAVIGWASGKAPEQAKAPEPFTLNPGDVRFDASGKQVATNPKPVEAPKPPTLGSFEDYVTRKYGANPTPEHITEARKVYQQADDRPIHINTGASANIPGNFDVTGESFLKSIPAQWRKTVEKIAKYDEDPTRVASMRGGMRETLMQWVNQVNPAYDSSMFGNRAPTRKAFTTGTQGQQINAINTAIGHINQITGVATELQNGGFVPGNRAWNVVRSAFGSDKVTNFDTLKDALAGEVASVLSKGGATVSGIAEAKEKISGANSPTQLAGYVKTLIPIMGSKLAEMNFQYHQAMGADDPFQALSPESREILQSLGFDPDKPQIGQSVASPTAAGSAATPNGKAPAKQKIGRFEVEVH